MKVRNQIVADDYALYLGDCMEILPNIPDDSVGMSIFSPPFYDLYSYSDDPRDMSNCATYEDFLKNFAFLVDQLFRIIMPGRIVAVHCMDLPTFKRNGMEIGLKDFPGDLVRLFQEKSFIYHSRHCIWKDPLVAAVRTKAIGLAHKQIVKDSSLCRMGIPDYLLAFRKPGENPKPIEHENGLTEYHGGRSIPMSLKVCEDQRKNKRSHWIWQQYASPVWVDIRQTKVLPFRDTKEANDLRHICPLSLDVIERCIVLWSAPGDVILTPFMGVGSEVFVAVKNDRKGVGMELKKNYYRQAALNVRQAKKDTINGTD